MIAEILLAGGQIALVDDCDVPLVSGIKWHVTTEGYVKGYVRRTAERAAHKVMMHRLILGLSKDDPREGDHENLNRLDNRRLNLRVCTHSQNCCNKPLSPRNTSGYKGVTLDKRRNKWHARLRIKNQQISLGYHSTPEAAHAAYCEAAKKHFGEFARI